MTREPWVWLQEKKARRIMWISYSAAAEEYPIPPIPLFLYVPARQDNRARSNCFRGPVQLYFLRPRPRTGTFDASFVPVCGPWFGSDESGPLRNRSGN